MEFGEGMRKVEGRQQEQRIVRIVEGRQQEQRIVRIVEGTRKEEVCKSRTIRACP